MLKKILLIGGLVFLCLTGLLVTLSVVKGRHSADSTCSALIKAIQSKDTGKSYRLFTKETMDLIGLAEWKQQAANLHDVYGSSAKFQKVKETPFLNPGTNDPQEELQYRLTNQDSTYNITCTAIKVDKRYFISSYVSRLAY